jgi:hypothetical protein
MLHAQHNPFGHYKTEGNKNTGTKIKEKMKKRKFTEIIFHIAQKEQKNNFKWEISEQFF